MQLTKSQETYLKLRIEGRSSAWIAWKLGLSTNAIKHRLREAYAALGLELTNKLGKRERQKQIAEAYQKYQKTKGAVVGHEDKGNGPESPTS